MKLWGAFCLPWSCAHILDPMSSTQSLGPALCQLVWSSKWAFSSCFLEFLYFVLEYSLPAPCPVFRCPVSSAGSPTAHISCLYLLSPYQNTLPKILHSTWNASSSKQIGQKNFVIWALLNPLALASLDTTPCHTLNSLNWTLSEFNSFDPLTSGPLHMWLSLHKTIFLALLHFYLAATS